MPCVFGVGGTVPSVGSTSFGEVAGFASLLDGDSWLCCEDFLVMGADCQISVKLIEVL